jgi:hypothetical protein
VLGDAAEDVGDAVGDAGPLAAPAKERRIGCLLGLTRIGDLHCGKGRRVLLVRE